MLLSITKPFVLKHLLDQVRNLHLHCTQLKAVSVSAMGVLVVRWKVDNAFDCRFLFSDCCFSIQVIDEVAGICCLRYSSPSKAVKMITPDPLVLDGDEPEAAESRDEAQLLVSED